MNGFILHLKGPMMSFGDTGFGQIRGAGGFPSRSVVLGIVAAARGFQRNDKRLLELHRKLRVHAAAIHSGAPGVDYHIVQPMEYEEETIHLHRRRREDVSSVITWREYLHDAHFMALVEGDDAGYVDECALKLRHPEFTTYLGRRSCPPSLPLLPEIANGEHVDQVFHHAYNHWLDAEKDSRGRVSYALLRRLPKQLDIWLDSATPPDNVKLLGRMERRDLLAALPRSYVNRMVTHVRMSLPAHVQPSSSRTEEYFHAAP